MAAHTPDFGLNYFGPGVPGSVTDEGGKFTLGDRLVISRILAALARHDHKGGARLTDPSATPAVTLDAVSGQLSGGLNIYYRISYIDEYGLETAASAEAVVSTPALLAAPSFPILTGAPLPDGSTATGLGGGLYTYALTAIAGPSQTPLGIGATLSLDGAMPTVVVTFPDAGQDGQDQWGVWRKGPGESYFTFLDAVAIIETSYTDDGSTLPDADAADPSHQPPSTNVTNSSNAITVVVPDPTLVGADPSAVKRWRLYRTFSSGSYAASSLLAEVSSTANADGTGGLLTEFTDDGSLPLQLGQPLDISQTLTPSVKVEGGGGGGGGAIQLRSTGGTTAWALSASLDGALVTDHSHLPVGVGDLYLWPGVGQPWKVTVDDDGTLRTTVGTPTLNDLVYDRGTGPMLATPDATLAYLLTVADDGALVTTANGVAHVPSARIGNGAPGRDGTEYDGLLYIDRLTGFLPWVFDAGSWRQQGALPTLPGAPMSVSGGRSNIDANHGLTAIVVFEPPADTGGYPVLRYRMTAVPLDPSVDPVTVTFTPDQTNDYGGGQRSFSLTMTGAPYAFSLWAQTVVGEGAAGSDYILGLIPVQMTDVATSVTGSTLHVTWTEPTDHSYGGPCFVWRAPLTAPDWIDDNGGASNQATNVANGWIEFGSDAFASTGALDVTGVPAGSWKFVLVRSDSTFYPDIYSSSVPFTATI